MKLTTKYLSIYLYIFLVNTSFISCIIEIPLYPIKVKGIPKYRNISVLEPYEPDFISLSEKGNSFMNANRLFLATIKIGSEAQTFNLILDTGSSILWVGRNNCGGNNGIINKFNPSTSKTAQNTFQTFNMRYGSGSCYGTYYSDNIEYIPNKKFNMYFGVASSADFVVDRCDGIIGLSKKYDDNRLSFLHMLKENKNTDSLVFSVKFEEKVFYPYIEGTMYIGEHEDFKKKEAVSVPMVFYASKIFWACTLSSFGLNHTNNYLHSDYENDVIFDTGTNYIILPMEYLNAIKNELYKFNCSIYNKQLRVEPIGDLPDLVFQFDRHTFTLPGKYVFFYSSNGYYLSFVSFQESGTFIIGSPFFFVFHTLFDEYNDELKFYPLKGGKIQSGKKKLSTVAIVFIALGCIVVVVGLVLIIYFSVKKCKEKKNKNIIPETIGEDYYGLYK